MRGKREKKNPETDAISWSKKSLQKLLDNSHEEEEDVEDGKWTLGCYKFLPCPN
jgi:hypothetical protein